MAPREVIDIYIMFCIVRGKHIMSSSNSKNACGKLPALYDFTFVNKYWQRMEVKAKKKKDSIIYLYAAYLDDRVTSEPMVRVLGGLRVRKSRTL